jgi:multidrug resistance efflux pump
MYQPLHNCFRKDLIISPNQRRGEAVQRFLIKNPSSGEIFELSEKEYFLCQLMDGNLTPSQIRKAFQEKFESTISEYDFWEFSRLLDQYNLLTAYSKENQSDIQPQFNILSQEEFEQELDHSIKLIFQENERLRNERIEAEIRKNLSQKKSSILKSLETEIPKNKPRKSHLPFSQYLRSLYLKIKPQKPDESSETFESEFERSLESVLQGSTRHSPQKVGAGVNQQPITHTATWSLSTTEVFEQDFESYFSTISQKTEDYKSPESPTKAKKRNPRDDYKICLVDPSRFFQAVARILQPLSFLVWLLVPGMIFALLIISNHAGVFWYALVNNLWDSINLIEAITTSLLTVNLFSVACKGIVFSSFGGTAKELGIQLNFGFFPLFYVSTPWLKQFNRRTQLWTFATPILARLFILSYGTLGWYFFQNTQTQLSTILLFLAQSAFFGLVVELTPFWDSSGYRWWTTYFHLPGLMKRSMRLGDMLLHRRPLPKTLSTKQKIALQVYAIFLIAAWIAIFVIFTPLIALLLEENFSGTGVILFLIIFVLILRWFLKMTSQPNPSGSNRSNPSESRMMLHSSNGTLVFERNKFLHFLQKNAVPIVSIVGGAILLALPYEYHPGGAITLLPPKQQTIQADVSGKITEVFLTGGDGAWIKKGTPIARLEASRQLNPATPTENDALVLLEQINNQKAIVKKQQDELDKLLNTPRPEEVTVAKTDLEKAIEEFKEAQAKVVTTKGELEVAKSSLAVTENDVKIAQQNLETVKIRADYNQKEASRLESLWNEGALKLQQYEEAQKQAEASRSDVLKEQQNVQQKILLVSQEQQTVKVKTQEVQQQKQNVETYKRNVEQKQANLSLIMSGPHPEQIAAARQDLEAAKATLREKQQQLKYTQGQLQGSNLSMPFDGQIVTQFLDQKVNTYLQQGQTFALVQDNRNIRGELLIPETDVGEFTTDSKVEVKIWAYPNHPMEGRVISIEPATSEDRSGRFVKVLVELPNSDKLLKAEMSGYAKIDGRTMPVIAAFTRPIVRFLQIEIWSWLP